MAWISFTSAQIALLMGPVLYCKAVPQDSNNHSQHTYVEALRMQNVEPGCLSLLLSLTGVGASKAASPWSLSLSCHTSAA